jgi:cell division protein ZapA (FtsZ GTPase activity inhibitor)
MDGESGDRKQVKVTILNQSFTLLTSGEPQSMVDLAGQVDDLMHSIARKSPNLDSTRVAVYACLQLADQLREREQIMDTKVKAFAEMLDKAIE